MTTSFPLQTFGAADVDDILQLEGRVAEFPWRREHIVSSVRAGHHCYCLRDQGRIIAFAIVAVVRDNADLLNIAVAGSQQRQGLGSTLLRAVLDRLEAMGVGSCMLEVRPSNQPALKLYYQLGFYEVGRRPDYYPARDGREDALLLCLPMNLSFAQEDAS